MRSNIGTTQRLVRLIAGLACLGLYGVLTPPWQYLALLGLIPLASALTGFRPAHTWLGRSQSQPGPGRGRRSGHRTPADVRARPRRYPPRVVSDNRFELSLRGSRMVDPALRAEVAEWKRQGGQSVSSDDLRPPARPRVPGVPRHSEPAARGSLSHAEDAHGA